MRTGFDTLVTTPLDMSLNTTPCVSCGRCAETCPTGALMPKPRVLEKYDVDESRCILCGICVDACPYDALRLRPRLRAGHDSRAEPMIDLMAISAIDRDTEISYVRRERDWLARAQADGRGIPAEPAAARCCLRGPGRATGARAGEPARRRSADHAHSTQVAVAQHGAAADRSRTSAGRWDDLVFLILAGVMLGAALLVVLGPQHHPFGPVDGARVRRRSPASTR